jgi:hypothetical protein
VIPRFGYRLADMRDDLELSAEVREARGVYRLSRTFPGVGAASRWVV